MSLPPGNMVGLATLCASMDMDGSGALSLEEMLEGFDSSEDFKKLMQCMATCLIRGSGEEWDKKSIMVPA